MTDVIQQRRAMGHALLAATFLSGLAAPAFAQNAQPATGGSDADIVVTALKRDTRLQETPIAISAVSAQTIANSGVQNIADLRSQVPSLSFVDGGPSNRRVVIRGIQATGEPTVGVYYDETPVTGTVGASNDAGGSTPELRLFDVERVEALRGPQGTLYGSGSMGGTLRIIYKKPSYELGADFDGSLSGTQHGGANQEMNGMINVPIVDQKVALRAVGFFKRNSGYIDNTWLRVKDINAEESYGGRVMLRIQPVEQWTIDAAAYYNKSTTDTPTWLLESGKYKTDSRTRQVVRDEVKLYSLTSNYDFGPVIATGVVSYMERNLVSQSDTSRFIQGTNTLAGYNARCFTATGAPNGCTDQFLNPITSFKQYQAFVAGQSTSSLYPQQDLNALTAELRLSSASKGPIHWTVGGFYSRRRTNVANPQLNVNPLNGYVIPTEVDTIRFIYDQLKQVAAFGELSWDLTSRLNITGGVRYFKYTKNVVGHTDVPSILVGARLTPPTYLSSSEDGTVVKANASYKITPDIMFYAEAAQGFRPGGVNQVLGLAQSLTPYRSDSLWNYEAGFKTSWLNHKLIVNLDAFRIDWTNMQVTQRTPNGAFSYIGNAAAARVQGVEFETSIQPVHGLSINGNATYMTAKLTEDQLAANLATASSGRAGDRIPYVPKFTAGVGAQYTWPLFGEVNGLVRGDFSHSSGYYSDFRPSYVYTRYINGYELVNTRIGIEKPNDWGAYIFVNNLFDVLAISRASSSAIGVGLTSVTSARPRTIGLNLRKTF
ncbi:TonB-dependent receptor [Sphingomonas lycopersici]|uniref:TonB-dependent receptor n=1 Tax=Sphingomonas lycopersici TaxID=2951807 RepID=A0AA41ZAT1_9SPHN|nr:TonB-dependent receptor [Sphingomonas lycopersici]MCW6537150.1 TonB-dependent receptor [Sphingomonas lycopersici]